MKNNIIIGFYSDKICKIVSSVLRKNAFEYKYICKTASSLRKVCSFYDEGIVICSFFQDEPLYNIIQDFSNNFKFIVFTNNDFDLKEKNVYKVFMPIKQEQILYTLNEVFEDIKKQNDIIIKNAKSILMQKYNLTEEKAHKYIQKKSMDLGLKSSYIAKLIIEKYT